MTQQHLPFMADTLKAEEQKRRTAAILRERWHQDSDYDIARDLHICKRLVKAGWERERLNDALEQYEGPAASLRITYKRGNRHILQRLDKRARKEKETRTTPMSEALQDFARSILDGD